MYEYVYILQAKLISLNCHISQLCLNCKYGGPFVTPLDRVEYSLILAYCLFFFALRFFKTPP